MGTIHVRAFVPAFVRAVAASAICALCLLPAAAFAQETYGGGASVPDTAAPTASEVSDAEVADPGDPGTSASSSASSRTLPLTGGDIAAIGAIGVGALAGGFALARSGRRRATA